MTTITITTIIMTMTTTILTIMSIIMTMTTNMTIIMRRITDTIIPIIMRPWRILKESSTA